MRKFYALEQEENKASIMIYGDITSWPWMDSDVSAYLLSQEIAKMDATQIDVYINSYGGEVAEALAIYNALRRNGAKIVTHCDGFACSAASLIFMAGEERLMGVGALLMIHNAWSGASGNAEELRKAAEDLDAISAAAADLYRAHVSITDEELDKLLQEESWIPSADAISMGFATGTEQEMPTHNVPAATARGAVMARICKKQEPKKPQHNGAQEPRENGTIKFLQALMR